MSVELVLVAYPSTSIEQKFFAVAKVRGEYFDIESPSPSGVCVTAAPMEHPLNKMLVAAGIEPFSLRAEADMRAALRVVGLSCEEIETKFESARRWNATIKTHE